MGLFKILRGDSSRISTSTTPFHDGYAYFTPDDGGFYIDATSGNSNKRIRINIPANDQAPTYTEASANAELASGEKLSVAFGKIAKAISSLISHIANKSNPHGVTASQVGAVPTTRTVNSKALSGNITLTASDVGARPASWMPTAAQVGAATPSSQKTVTLTVSGWSASAPYTQKLAVSGLATSSNGDIAVAQSATTAQREAARKAIMSVTAQTSGSLTITADGTKPSINIPVTVTIIG